MKKKKVLIIGYGSIGRRHARILKKNAEVSDICVSTSQNCRPFKKIKNLGK